MDTHLNNPLWVERYRPITVESCILPTSLKKTFQTFVDNKSIPNLLLTGSSGTGKTTIAKAMLNELKADYVIFNSSLEVDKDTLRNEIKSFSTTVSLLGTGRKYIILDEADYLSANHVQPALRTFMEEYSFNVGFILTCNYKNKIISPIHSRCSVIEFVLPRKEKERIAKDYYTRCLSILSSERIKYDKGAVVGVIKHFFPDFRRTINELQRYSISGAIDSGILTSFPETSVDQVIKYLKEKNITEVRRWVLENQDIDSVELFRILYDSAGKLMAPDSVARLILILAKYQYQSAFAADHVINTTACLVDIMMGTEFK